MPRLVAVVCALGLIIGFRAASDAPTGIPLVQLPQGVSAWTFDGTRVLVERTGSLILTAYLPEDPDTGDEVWWCPITQVFLAPATASMWDRTGRYVIGPTSRDLTQLPLDVDDERLAVTARIDEPRVAEGRSDGEIIGEAKVFYDEWLAGGLLLGEGFCRDAVR